MQTKDLADRDRTLKEAIQYQEAFLTQAYMMLRNWAEAEDVVQNAFLVVADKWESFEKGSSVFAWVKQIVRYKALEAIRRRKRETSMEEANLQNILADTLDSFFVMDKAEHQRRLKKALAHCIARLGETPVKILVAFYWRSETSEMISKTLRRSANSVRLALSRTRQQLRMCLSQTLPQTEMET